MKTLFSLLIAGVLLTSCQYKDTAQRILSVYADNPVEEWVEDVIEDQTGVKIDFTGDSEE